MAKGRGYAMFVFEGEVVEAPRSKSDEKTGEVRTSLNLAYMGGSQYVRLANPSQAEKVRKGSWIRVECGVRSFKDQTYAGEGTITHIDEQPYKAG